MNLIKQYKEHYANYPYPLSFQKKTVTDSDKTMLVGDPHFNFQTPLSRMDDYAQTTLDKIAQLKKVAMVKGVNRIIFLGDVFHKPNQPLPYLIKLIQALTEIKEQGIDLFTINGNSHDVFNDRQDTLPRPIVTGKQIGRAHV